MLDPLHRFFLLLINFCTFARIAQLVEQGIENPRVGGSSPSLGTINF